MQAQHTFHTALKQLLDTSCGDLLAARLQLRRVDEDEAILAVFEATCIDEEARVLWDRPFS